LYVFSLDQKRVPQVPRGKTFLRGKQDNNGWVRAHKTGGTWEWSKNPVPGRVSLKRPSGGNPFSKKNKAWRGQKREVFLHYVVEKRGVWVEEVSGAHTKIGDRGRHL